jgi:hypothetical protein
MTMLRTCSGPSRARRICGTCSKSAMASPRRPGMRWYDVASAAIAPASDRFYAQQYFCGGPYAYEGMRKFMLCSSGAGGLQQLGDVTHKCRFLFGGQAPATWSTAAAGACYQRAGAL